jgi:serine/threonine-protein kinase
MGTVYHAVDEMLEREVALKVLDAELEQPQKRFRAEAMALGRLSHPAIAQAYQFFQHDGRWIMAMELVNGQTLSQIAAQVGPFPPVRAARICMQVLEGLAHAHDAGIVHRDLKPSNVMLTTAGAVKIMDFGIARLEGTAHITQAGVMVGTPAYMAPEQVLGREIDGRADLYAVGVLFYRLITGELPFRGRTPFAMAQSHLRDSPTPIDLVRPDVPSWAQALVDRALAKDPADRFQSAMEFHESIARCLAGERVAAGALGGTTEKMSAPFPRRIAPARRAAAGGNAPAWSGIAVTALAALAIGVGLWRRSSEGVPPPASLPEPTAAAANVPVMDGSRPAGTTPDVPTPQPQVVEASAGAIPGGAMQRTAPVPSPVPAVFGNVKWLAVQEGRTSDRDVQLLLSKGRLDVVTDDARTTIATIPYRQIAKATYVRARDPRWDPLLSAPADKINVPGVLGKPRHWLVVQTRQTYAIFRLDGNDWAQVLAAFTARTAVPIDGR